MKIISLFSGCGGLDLGFNNKGFKLVFANDNDRDVWSTFEKNHNIVMDKRSITDIKSEELPEADGIIGGPPCQSWSLAGSMKGVNDSRGKLFYEYIRILKDKKPKFFVAENVPGLISKTHLPEFKKILKELEKVGYTITYKLLNARDYNVPQIRKRVIIVGYRNDLNKSFTFPEPRDKKITLKEAIGDLNSPLPAKDKNRPNEETIVSNHEYMNGGFSSIFMSRNRRKNWDEQSFTIQAGGRHAPIHPSSEEMIKIGQDEWQFKSGEKAFHRRLSVRECARIQTFPDDFIFLYDNVTKGYKMVGNAVPVKLSEVIAKKIKEDLEN